RVLDPVRDRHGPDDDDHRQDRSGPHGRVANPDRDDDRRQTPSAATAADRYGLVWHDRNPRPGHGPVAWRLAHREFELALCLLRQRAGLCRALAPSAARTAA